MSDGMKFSGWIGVGVIVLLIVWLVIYSFSKTDYQPELSSTQTIDVVEFAEYLASEGWTMYGINSCGYCKIQREAFGVAIDKIVYVDCFDIDTKAQKKECRDMNITGYPSWVSPDGEIFPGSRSLESLAQLTKYEQSIF